MGMTLTIRGSSQSNIADDFNRANGPLLGSMTSVGARTWNKPSSGDAVASIVSQKLMCTLGASTDIYVFDANGVNFDMTLVVAERGTDDIKHSVIFRAVDDANHLALLFRVNGTTQGYCIANRVDGVYTFLLTTSEIPKVNDIVSLNVDGVNVTLFVNGINLGTAKVPTTTTDKTLFGFRMAGADRTTAFDSLTVKTKV